jgi:lyso-ornithine lipid O-acyltransferase
MQAIPRRLRRASTDRSQLPRFSGEADGIWVPTQRQVLRRIRAVIRVLGVLIWTPFAIAAQTLMLMLPGRGKVVMARLYWAIVCRILGLEVRVIGQPATGRGRPVVFVSNHSSWLDIPAIGGTLDGCFVAKSDVANWPLVSTIARLGRTLFVSRQRATTGRERQEMQERLAQGDNLILFPEGTSSDGSRVLPFFSPFFAIAEGEPRPLIQPVSLVYDRLAGLPVGRASRPVFAWYGDMALAPHFWHLAQWRGMRATVLLHTPLDPAEFASRKALSQAAWTAVANGAAALRQNRTPRPAPGSLPAPVGDTAFA